MKFKPKLQEFIFFTKRRQFPVATRTASSSRLECVANCSLVGEYLSNG